MPDVPDMTNPELEPRVPPMGLSGAAAGYLRAWAKYENAQRTTCPVCHFESSAGYPASHAPGCTAPPFEAPNPEDVAVTEPDDCPLCGVPAEDDHRCWFQT